MFTFGEKHLSLNLGFGCEIKWNFCSASIPYPILGGDFLAHYGLTIDLSRRKLIDTIINFHTKVIFRKVASCSVNKINHQAIFSEVLSKYPEITCPSQGNVNCTRIVFHHIITDGPPFAERARRLPPEKLKPAKEKFKNWLEQGKCHYSDSSKTLVQRYLQNWTFE